MPRTDEDVAHDLASVWHRSHRPESNLPPIERWHHLDRIAWVRVAQRARQIYALKLPIAAIVLLLFISGMAAYILLTPARESQPIALDPTPITDYTAGN